MSKLLTVFVVQVFVLASACSAGLLVNGSFESPDTNDWTDSNWASTGGGAREKWAAHSGGRGVAIPTWGGDPVATNEAKVSQLVTTSDITTGQVYTFSSWIRKQPAVRDQAIQLQIRWYDASWSGITTLTENISILGDDAWHHVYMTRTASAPSIVHAAVAIQVQWLLTNQPGASALMMDDADFYEGSYTGAPFANGSLSHTNTESYGWAGSGWNRATLQLSTNDPRVSLADWANHSGAGLGAVFQGWDPDDGGAEFFQNFAPGTGTYTFAVWINRQANFNLSNAELRIGWYDASFTNKVQPDSIRPLEVSGVDGWHEYFVTGQCGDPNLCEVRVSVVAKWQEFDGQANAMMVDDARVLSGAYAPTYAVAFTNGSFENPVNTEDWNDTGWTSSGNARRTNWAARTGARGLVFESWAANQSSVFQDIQTVGGTYTFSAWVQLSTNSDPKSLRLMLEWGGEGGSLIKTDSMELNAMPQDGQWYRGFVTGTCTNSDIHFVRPKIFALWGAEKVSGAGANTIHVDDSEFYAGTPTAFATLTNGDFEVPAVEDSWSGSGWSTEGWVGKRDWAAHTNQWGGVFGTWSAESGMGAIYQDVAATGGTYTFSVWLLKQSGSHATNTQLRLEWYNGTQWQPLQADVAPLNDADVPSDGRWHHVWITGTYAANDALFVRPKLLCQYDPGASSENAIMFDDAELYHGAHVMPSFPSVLRDGGFETPHTNWQELGWSQLSPVYLADYAALDGDLGGLLPTWEKAQQGAIYQDISVAPGTYTFSLWLRQQIGTKLTNASVALEWYNGAQFAPVQVDMQSASNVPPDGQWHLIFVTGAYSGGDLSFVRPVFRGQYDQGDPAENAVLFDHAEFYAGSFAGIHAFTNGDFADVMDWWAVTPGQSPIKHHVDWDGHSGAHILAVEGWVGSNSYTSVVAQTLSGLAPGTYRFSGWFQRSLDFALNQANLRVQGYNVNRALLFDVVTNITILPNAQWTQFSVDVPCTAAGLYEVVPSIGLAWTKVDGSLQMDDFAFELVAGGSDTDSDGVADSWELLHFGSLSGTGIGSNFDGDVWTDWQEYVADTDPKNASSGFGFAAPGNSAALRVYIGPPTTNSRVYQVLWSSNLLTGAWLPYMPVTPGYGDGGAIEVLITNNLPTGYYRARVAVP